VSEVRLKKSTSLRPGELSVVAKKHVSSPKLVIEMSALASAVRSALRPRASMWAMGALGTLMSLPASARQHRHQQPRSDADLTEIVVTGLRQSVESAQASNKTRKKLLIQ